MIDERRIYVVVPATIQVPGLQTRYPLRTVAQPAGRQIAQACHVVSKLRQQMTENYFRGISLRQDKTLTVFEPITTIILQARDSAETAHVHFLLHKKRLNVILFSDTNPEYGTGAWPTALAVHATKKQVEGILDYLPLWGAQ